MEAIENKVSHTPGPWKLSQSPVRISKLGGLPFKSIKNTSSIGGKIIANAFGTTREEAQANAKLIAAAPELLEALRHLIDTSDMVPSARKKALDAIEKATE